MTSSKYEMPRKISPLLSKHTWFHGAVSFFWHRKLKDSSVPLKRILELQDQQASKVPLQKRSYGLTLGLDSEFFVDKFYRRRLKTNSIIVFSLADHWTDKHIQLNYKYASLMLAEPSIDKSALRSYFRSFRTKIDNMDTFPDYAKSLDSLFRASVVYKDLPAAFVDLLILDSVQLHQASWVCQDGQSPQNLSLPQKLACITAFESGFHNLDLDYFNDVVAISAGNTLYVSKLLIKDPASVVDGTGLHCLIGNIGRPGIALLLLAKEPELREYDLESWDQVNHNAFDGSLEDNFQCISVHLKLTCWKTRYPMVPYYPMRMLRQARLLTEQALLCDISAMLGYQQCHFQVFRFSIATG